MADTDKKQTKQNVKHEVIKDPLTGVETTGHVWDDTLMEFNNPIPGWWLWAFYGTIVFTIAYWVMYPSWPTGLSEKGFLYGTKEISYKSDAGEDVSTHWNTRALLAHDMQNDPNELKRLEMVKTVAATPLASVVKDPQQSAFVLAYGKGIFGDYCAGCHQTGGQGVIGDYPNLIDDAWLWGSDSADIETTIRKGRTGNMPAHKASMSDAEITQTANYVLSLSGESVDSAAAEHGKKLFNTKGCSGCHMPTGVGMKALGAANLTDKIWTQANVPAAVDSAAKVAAVKTIISNGFKREMPAWESRLSNDEIKVLVAYIKLLSAE
jgi:cytochrome c oxidase cbb3-type subunit 3